MDVALKQRLVGAAVLVALGVIFIPMLLEGPRQDLNETAIPIPDQPDRRFETRLLPVDPGNGTAPEAPEPTSGERPEVVSVARTGDPTAGAVPAGGNPGRPDGARQWTLQLGSFGNAANAARLVKTLKEAGWDAYQEKVTVAENTLYRVRAGSWNSKDEALEAGAGIGSQFKDLDVSVRALGGAAGDSANAPLSGWMVQVGSFSLQQNAYALRDQLRAGGVTAHVDAGSAGSSSFKVLAGPELDRASAEQLRARLRKEFDLNGIILDRP